MLVIVALVGVLLLLLKSRLPFGVLAPVGLDGGRRGMSALGRGLLSGRTSGSVVVHVDYC